MGRIGLVFIVFSFVFSAFGQIEQVRKWTEMLCSPEFHGRGYVNGGDSIAANYLEQEFQKIGLTAVPGQSSMRQNFHFEVNTFPGKMEVQLGDLKLKPGRDFIAKENSGSFTGQLNYKVISGKEVINTQWTLNEMGRLKDEGINGLIFDFSDISGDDVERAQSAISTLMGSFVVIELTSAKFTWSVARLAKTYPHIQLRDSLWKGQKTIRIDIENQMKVRHDTQNIIAFLPAKRKTDKTVFFTGHYDHLGRMGAETYFPGANDNASGCAMLLSLAAHFKLYPAKYNLVFAAFAGEEAGIIGSFHYVLNPTLPLDKIQFLLNLDIFGSGEEGITAVNATLFPKEFKKLQKINRKRNLLSTVNSRGPAANSDHYAFTQKGVPTFFIYTMGPNKNYHDIFDTYEALSFAEYRDLMELLIRFVKKV